MNAPVSYQPALRVNSDPRGYESGSVSVCCLGPDLVAVLASCPQPDDLLKSIFRVTVVQEPSPVNSLPNVSGRYLLLEDEVRFIPHFPFERELKYHASFDPRLLGSYLSEELTLEFTIPSDAEVRGLTSITHVFPSSDLLPENLLRFYVCFSSPMQRGQASEEISLVDSDGQPVADALYRPPVELWDRTMQCLTVLLDPGRLKRWVGPNVELGPPLEAGQQYTLEIGSGMLDQYGRPLGESFRKHFLVSDPIRQRITLENWKVLSPATGSRETLVLSFPSPLDWALLRRTITIQSRDGSVIDGQIVVDQGERRWSFTPKSSWAPGVYNIRVGPELEDACGNDIAGPFDRLLKADADPAGQVEHSTLTFELAR